MIYKGPVFLSVVCSTGDTQ